MPRKLLVAAKRVGRLWHVQVQGCPTAIISPSFRRAVELACQEAGGRPISNHLN